MLLFPHTMNNANQSNEVFEWRIPVIDLFFKKIVTLCSDKTILNASAALKL